jgi:hypothetical protein
MGIAVAKAMGASMAAATHDIDLPEMIAYTNCEPNSYF